MLRFVLRLFLLASLSEAIFNIHLGQNTILYWELDYTSDEFVGEIHTTNWDSKVGGWNGIGFSSEGNLSDGTGDFCVLWRNHLLDHEVYQLTDVHILEGTHEMIPDHQQDCKDFQFTIEKNSTIKWTFRRKFVTCDHLDYALEEGTTHLHWGKGDGPLYNIKGVSIQEKVDVGFERVRFLKNNIPPAELDPTTTTFDVRNSKVSFPATETMYWCQIVKLPKSLQRKHHVVKFGAEIEKGNEEFVHHMEVFHCETDAEKEIPLYAGPCDKQPKETKICNKVIGAWAMGADPLTYPKQAGYPIGGKSFNPFVRLEMHYNNPKLKSNWVDSSGMRFWITEHLREIEAGVIELGLEYSDKMAIPPHQEGFLLTGICNFECTSVGLPEEGITVFASQLHTHLTGTRVITRHFRRGFDGQFSELPALNWDNHYSTHYQEIRLLKSPTKVLPGDILLTTCEYQTSGRENITLGGFSISEEMCVNYIHYYPRTRLEVCKSSVSWIALRDYFHFMAEEEGQDIDAEAAVSENYYGIRWTPFRAKLLSDFYNNSPIDMQCNQSDGSRFPGSWDSMEVVKLPPLQPKPNLNQECLFI